MRTEPTTAIGTSHRLCEVWQYVLGFALIHLAPGDPIQFYAAQSGGMTILKAGTSGSKPPFPR